MKKRKILFLGETHRADAITWMNGLKEFGNFEMITWELKTPNTSFWSRLGRFIEYSTSILQIKKIIKSQRPDMIIAERTTSYGFLAVLSGMKVIAIAQQGRTDLWPERSRLLPLKKIIQRYAFKKAHLIHAWGPVMTISMKASGVDMNKVMVLPKGIDLSKFKNNKNLENNKLKAIITRSLQPEYRHNIILKAFEIIDKKGIEFELTIVGDGTQMSRLKELAKSIKIESKVHFTGRIPNETLPELLQNADFYISMPITEGVSASLFEAMASNCFPVVTDIPGNQSWIQHRKNGQLVTIDDSKMLAEELLWAFGNNEIRSNAIIQNRKFIEEHVSYSINMKIIADKYHDLIDAYKR